MTRVGTFGHTQILVTRMLEQQRRVVDDQMQISSGYRAGQFKDFGRDLSTMLSAESTKSRTETYQKSNAELKLRLEYYNQNMDSLASAANSIRQDIIEAINLNSPMAFVEKIEDTLLDALGILNTRLDGRYIFGGTRTETAPMAIATPADLMALTNISDAFNNNQIKQTQKVGENDTMEFGILASDIGTGILTSIQRILRYNAGTLPGSDPYTPGSAFSTPLSTNQRDFLTDELANITAAAEQLNADVAVNGVRMARLETVEQRHTEELTFLTIFISDIKDVDAGEAITRLNQDNTALQASYRVLSQLNEMTLQDFL